MKTIRKQEEIAFNALTFKDAVVLLPLMNALAELVNHNRVAKFHANLPQEEREKYRRVWERGDMHIQEQAIESIYKLLSDLGFESQVDVREPKMEDLEPKN
jgi:predicted ArsR family transcriptional regulator